MGRILEERGSDQDVDVQELVNDAFLAVDEQLAVALQQGRASGCTAIMAYIRKEGNAVRIANFHKVDQRTNMQVFGSRLPTFNSYRGYSTLEM